jgi:hypothetical protein
MAIKIAKRNFIAALGGAAVAWPLSRARSSRESCRPSDSWARSGLQTGSIWSPLSQNACMNSVGLRAVPLRSSIAGRRTIELPLWEWNLPDIAPVTVQDLMRDVTFAWHGKLQRIRLDPTDLFFAIWRITPHSGG